MGSTPRSFLVTYLILVLGSNTNMPKRSNINMPHNTSISSLRSHNTSISLTKALNNCSNMNGHPQKKTNSHLLHSRFQCLQHPKAEGHRRLDHLGHTGMDCSTTASHTTSLQTSVGCCLIALATASQAPHQSECQHKERRSEGRAQRQSHLHKLPSQSPAQHHEPPPQGPSPEDGGSG